MFKKVDWGLCAVIVVTLLFSVVYLNILDRFWFEDDPFAYQYARKIGNPLEIFFNPEIMRHFGTGSSLVPMQLLSYWLDIKLFGVSTVAAYLHSCISLVATSSLLYLFFRKLTGQLTGAALLALAWTVLPSTIAVHFFIATRHYMEGFTWSLIACLMTVTLCSDEHRERKPLLLGMACLAALAAMLSKELYVTTLPSFIFLYSLGRKRYDLAALQVVVAILYLFYRFWIIGGVGDYPVGRLDWQTYLIYLSVLPYTLASHKGGYAILLGMVTLILYLAAIRRKEAIAPLLMIFVLLVTALMAAYPTASPVLGSYQIPGTWYRGTFIVNLVLFLSMGYLLLRFTPRTVQVAALLLIVAVLLPGIRKTRDYWDFRLTNAENEARFYLANPDKLIMSEERAHWFMPHIHNLYGVTHPHYLNMQSLKGDHAKEMVERFPTIWRISNGVPFPDDRLYWEVRIDNSRNP